MNKFITDLMETIQSYYESIIDLLPKLALAIIVFSILFFLANRSRNFVSSRLSKRMDDMLLARFIARLVKISMVIFGLLIVLKIVGLTDIATGIITGASVSAIVVGFAFKDIGENLLAGVMLAFNRPFRVGDTVELSGHQGKIVLLNLRDTQIKTFDGKDIYIPNASIVKNPVINYTIDGFLRKEVEFGVDYVADVEEAKQLLLNTLNTVSGILKEDKEPSVFISKLGSSSVTIKGYYWLDTFDKSISSAAINDEVIERTLQAMSKAGINLPGDIIELKNYADIPMKMLREDKANDKG